MDNFWIVLVLFPLASYVVGSIPTGVLIARSRGVDLRKVGSGNTGATNVGRVLGRKWGLLCFAIDTFKGALPVAIAGLLLSAGPGDYVKQVAWLLVGFATIMGNMFSIFMGFRGGKGVATALGVLLGTFPYFTWAGLTALGVWLAVTYISRYVSVGSIVAVTVFAPLVIAFNWQHWTGIWPMVAFGATMATLIVIRHRANIGRLIKGTENKIGTKKVASSQ